MRRAKVLIVPSWYPSPDSPTAGIFIHQQAQALCGVADVAVLYVRETPIGATVRAAAEDGISIVRADIEMPPRSRTIPGRMRAVATNLFNRFFTYRREGLSAF
ncbi:MAG: hypothetical protein JXR33_05825, partial [Coriobacteriia bacterium]|nr:hypothetical protein [Coriobacteriia bacterium]